MNLLGSPDLCPCGADSCVEVDGIVWLCERCADVITREYRKAYPVASTPLDVNAAASLPAPAPGEAAAINPVAKATEGKAGMAVVTGHVRRSTAGTGLRVGAASAVLPATSEFMDVTAGETAPNSVSDASPSEGPDSCQLSETVVTASLPDAGAAVEPGIPDCIRRDSDNLASFMKVQLREIDMNTIASRTFATNEIAPMYSVDPDEVSKSVNSVGA